MRRWVKPILICLIVGAITTVGVAWGQAYVFPVRPRSIEMNPVRYVINGREVNEKAFVGRSLAGGICSVRRVKTGDGQELGSEKKSRVPAWTGAILPFEEFRQGRYGFEIRVFEGRGFPFVALRTEYEFEARVGPALSFLERGIALPRERYVLHARIQRIVLPTEVNWPGFLGNTGIVASVIWLVWPLKAHIVRTRRKRRGQCLACGYSLQGLCSAKCPECGWNRAEAEA